MEEGEVKGYACIAKENSIWPFSLFLNILSSLKVILSLIRLNIHGLLLQNRVWASGLVFSGLPCANHKCNQIKKQPWPWIEAIMSWFIFILYCVANKLSCSWLPFIFLYFSSPRFKYPLVPSLSSWPASGICSSCKPFMALTSKPRGGRVNTWRVPSPDSSSRSFYDYEILYETQNLCPWISFSVTVS